MTVTMAQPKKGNPDEPNISFHSAGHKVRWAEKQINDLDRSLRILIDEHRKTGGGAFNSQTGVASIGNLSIDPWIACWVGDIIFSLRSALDCCWMGLARSINADSPKDTLPRGDAESVKVRIDKAPIKNTFPATEQFLLEDLQAYKGGNEILWFVGQVDNWNKHNMLVVVAQRTSVLDAKASVPGGPTIDLINCEFTGFPDGFISVSGATGMLKWQQNANVSFDIILKSRKPVDERRLMPFLRAALVDTRKGVDNFISKFGIVAS